MQLAQFNPFRGRYYTIDLRSNASAVRIGNLLGGGATYLNGLTQKCDLHIQVHPGVQISGAAVAEFAGSAGDALYIDMPAGSRIYLTNNGTIWGAGGRGAEGDRGRRDNTSDSPFVGGGGGGGAGPNSEGGLVARDDPTGGSFSPTPTAGTGATPGSTTGGAAGVQDPNEVAGASDGGYTRGVNPQYGGTAIYFGNGQVEIFIDNTLGLIYMGAKGGDGGYQNGSLSGGNTVDPTNGENTATSLTVDAGGFDGKAVSYPSAATLTWRGGYSYPSIRGDIDTRP